MCQSAIASARTPSGTLTKKIMRQEEASTSQPPSTGPSAVVSAENPAHVPDRNRKRENSKRHVDEENHAPGRRIDEPAAEHRPECRCQCGKSRPCARSESQARELQAAR